MSASAFVSKTAITDLADLSEADFAAAVKRADLAQKRAERILRYMLLDGVHYGNPLRTEDNQPAYPHPILYLSGAEVLTKAFRLSFYAIAPDRESEVVAPTKDFTTRIVDPGFVSVTMYRGISLFSGAAVSEHASNCNSREKRFQGPDGNWRYDDAREVLNECIAIARKRCKVHLVVDVLGLRPWLHTEEEMEAALRRKAEEAAMSPNAQGSAS